MLYIDENNPDFLNKEILSYALNVEFMGGQLSSYQNICDNGQYIYKYLNLFIFTN